MSLSIITGNKILHCHIPSEQAGWRIAPEYHGADGNIRKWEQCLMWYFSDFEPYFTHQHFRSDVF